MELGMIGLGKMGANMTTRLIRDGHRLVVTDLNTEAVAKAQSDGASGTASIEELVSKLSVPRVVWVMVPAGAPTEQTINKLATLLSAGDIVIDGGNSNYKETMSRAHMLKEHDIEMIDVGTSGGIWGITEGYSMMIGGAEKAVQHISPLLRTLAPAPDQGWGHVGPYGAGHFVKMVHNGIEYGMMQAYAEGFELMGHKEEFGLDLGQIAEIWRYGSVIRSWLLDLTAEALQENPTMAGIAPYVPDSGEGRWTVNEAIDLGVYLPVISLSLQNRFRSRAENLFTDKLLAAMRKKFGGHSVKES